MGVLWIGALVGRDLIYTKVGGVCHKVLFGEYLLDPSFL